MSRKIRLLLGGSPCTHWSIAQKNNRETEPEGLGWELFKNFLIAKEKFKPDYFLYENNKSMAKPIRNQIDIEFNRTYAGNTNWELVSTVEEGKGNTKRWLWRNKTTGKTEYITRILINSALVSAQNRQRYYWTNIPNVQQPADRGILLKDILEMTTNEQAYHLTSTTENAKYLLKNLKSTDEKSATLTATGLYACPINDIDGKARTIKSQYAKTSIANLTYKASYGATMVVETWDGKWVKTGLYACPIMPVTEATKQGYATISPGDCVDLAMINSKTRRGRNMKRKSNCLTTSPDFYQYCGTINKPIYEVRNGMITINGKQYPIKLLDGYYIIRKLTVKECCRLQTFPDNYFVKADGVPLVSNSQAYKQLGNSWTVEVIKHLLSYIPNLKDCDVRVLGMYDGISAGQLVLRELGANIVTYKAYEIDKYCLITTQYHFPNTIQCGDAFQVRNDEWRF